MNRNTLDLLRIETGLLHAFEFNELLLHYQPKVELAGGLITGAEALVRWQHPERGLLLPGDFIPIAEETGLIVQLSDWVLEAVCAQARQWKLAGLAPVRIAINITAREFTRSLPDRVGAALSRHQLTGDWLELEITESMLMTSTDRIISIMEKSASWASRFRSMISVPAIPVCRISSASRSIRSRLIVPSPWHSG